MSYLDGHIEGLRADISHIRRGRLGLDVLTDDERDRVKVRELAIVVLEQIRNERVAEYDQQSWPALVEEAGRAYQRGVVEGLSAAVGVVHTRIRLLSPSLLNRPQVRALRSLEAALQRLEQHHTTRPTTGGAL